MMMIFAEEMNETIHKPVLRNQSTPLHPRLTLEELEKLVILNITEAGRQVQCQTSHRCDTKTYFGIRIPATSIVDNKAKILMEFSPKAACTSAIVMFLNQTGYRYGIEYTGWPHTFRDQYYNPRCGRANACMYYDENWFRFKVVRNPWDRVVSSYIHIMTYKELREKFIPFKERNHLSFQKFIFLLEKMPSKDLQGFAGAHAGYQSHPYERILYQRRQQEGHSQASKYLVFHEIVQSENPLPALTRINQKLGTQFHLTFKAHHYADRKDQTQNRFVGNIPWPRLQSQIPRNYGLFYNPELKLRVHQLYLWDILLYNYSFPFNFQHLPNTDNE